jgi:hypothetical protein
VTAGRADIVCASFMLLNGERRFVVLAKAAVEAYGDSVPAQVCGRGRGQHAGTYPSTHARTNARTGALRRTRRRKTWLLTRGARSQRWTRCRWTACR